MTDTDQLLAGQRAPTASALPAAVETTAPPDDRRLAFLDSLRALSAGFVVVHHMFLAVFAGFPVNTGPGVLDPFLFGHFGVALFIVLSGFSLALVPARHGHELRGGFGRFMQRRAWRIIPPYWAALFLSLAIVALLVRQRMDFPLSVRGLFTHLLLVQDVVEGASPNGAFWSIAVEWQLYFVFPLFLLARRRVGPTVLGAAMVVLVILIKVAEGRIPGAEKILHLSPQFAALFVFGLVAASVTTRPSGAGWARWWGWAALASGLAVVAVCAALGTARSIDNLYTLDLPVGLATACLIAHLAGTRSGRIRRALEQRPLVAVGHYSYSLYLVHAPLLLVIWLFVVKPLGLSPTGSFVVMVLAAGPVILALSYLFHRAVERPFLARRSLRSLLRRQPAPT